MFYTPMLPTRVGSVLFSVLAFITNPVNSIFTVIVPEQWVQQSDGSYIGYISFLRVTFIIFINLIFYSVAGICAKLIKEKNSKDL